MTAITCVRNEMLSNTVDRLVIDTDVPSLLAAPCCCARRYTPLRETALDCLEWENFRGASPFTTYWPPAVQHCHLIDTRRAPECWSLATKPHPSRRVGNAVMPVTSSARNFIHA